MRGSWGLLWQAMLAPSGSSDGFLLAAVGRAQETIVRVTAVPRVRRRLDFLGPISVNRGGTRGFVVFCGNWVRILLLVNQHSIE